LNAVYLGGETNLQSRSLNRSAYAMHTTLDMRLAKDATAGLKFTHTSGDNDPYDRKDSAFWGYDADYYETYMFYDYGWAETLNYEPTVIDPHTGTKLGMYLFGPYLKTSLPFVSENSSSTLASIKSSAPSKAQPSTGATETATSGRSSTRHSSTSSQGISRRCSSSTTLT